MDGIIIQQDVVYKTEKGTPVTDSLKVAQVFNKEHKNIIRAIRNLMGSAQNCATANGSMNQVIAMHKANHDQCS